MYTNNPIVLSVLLLAVPFLFWLTYRKFFPRKVGLHSSRTILGERQRREIIQVVTEMNRQVSKAPASICSAARAYADVEVAQVAVAEQLAALIANAGSSEWDEGRLAIVKCLAEAQVELKVKCAAAREALDHSVLDAESLELALKAAGCAVQSDTENSQLLTELFQVVLALSQVLQTFHIALSRGGVSACLIAIETERFSPKAAPVNWSGSESLPVKAEQEVRRRRFSYGALPPPR